MAAGRRIAVVAATAAAYGHWVRPRLWRWGATDEEVAGPYPGAELVPEGERAATMAVTIDVPPDQVWPWLVQMGGDRGGWYSWDRLDIAWQVAALEPNRFLALRALRDLRGHLLDPAQPRPSAYVEGLWSFLLTEVPGGRTRLVISGYQALRPRWLERFVNYWVYMPVTWPMQARMLAVLKRNIERAAGHQAPARRSGRAA